MTKLIKLLNKPEYLYQPSRIARRILSKRPDPGREILVVQLPWNLPLEVNRNETIGRSISHHGIFELSLVEAIFRLVDRSDVVLDVGANLGYMTAVAISAGAKKVFSFEPHPDIFARLSRNMDMWIKARPELSGKLVPQRTAVSSKPGVVILNIPERSFKTNYGLATLEIEEGQAKNRYTQIEVPATTLDSIIDEVKEPIGVLKIDIEGHELQAFTGGKKSLTSSTVRDIFYEDHHGMASNASQLLSSFGYTIFGLNKTPLGPILLKNQADVERFARRSFEGSTNFLATLDSDRAKRRMSGWGYRSLRGSYR